MRFAWLFRGLDWLIITHCTTFHKRVVISEYNSREQREIYYTERHLDSLRNLDDFLSGVE